MTKKDQSVSENIDLSNDQTETPDSLNTGKKPKVEHKASEEIKNAHAAGDGAYGRSDKSVFAGEDNKDDSTENPAY